MRLPRVPAPTRHDPTHGSRIAARRAPGGVVLGLGLTLLGLTLLGPLACASATPGSPPAPARRNAAERPPPFATAPDVTIADATGTPRDLASLMGPKGLVLVLYRGHW